MTQETEREAFEEWAAPQGIDLQTVDDPNIYNRTLTVMAWKAWQARARVGKWEVGTLPFNGKPIGMEITSQKIWIGPMRKDGIKVDEILCGLECGDEYKVEYCESQKEKADFLVSSWNAALFAQAKPVESDTELTRLKRQVEVLSNCLVAIKKHSIRHNEDDYIINNAEQALAAADRIAKEQPHDKD